MKSLQWPKSLEDDAPTFSIVFFSLEFILFFLKKTKSPFKNHFLSFINLKLGVFVTFRLHVYIYPCYRRMDSFHAPYTRMTTYVSVCFGASIKRIGSSIHV